MSEATQRGVTGDTLQAVKDDWLVHALVMVESYDS
jgi:hypothetical protein